MLAFRVTALFLREILRLAAPVFEMVGLGVVVEDAKELQAVVLGPTELLHLVVSPGVGRILELLRVSVRDDQEVELLQGAVAELADVRGVQTRQGMVELDVSDLMTEDELEQG